MILTPDIFGDLEFEVEHPLYLARVRQTVMGVHTSHKIPRDSKGQANLIADVIAGKEEVERKPIWRVDVVWIPKYQAIMLGPDEDSAYRVLYETTRRVGTTHEDSQLELLLSLAADLAEVSPEPVGV